MAKAKQTNTGEEAVGYRAVAKHARIASPKVRQVIDLVKERPVDEALTILEFTPKAAARILTKLLNSAAANAETQGHISRTQLYVASLYADEGPALKRWRPRAMGRIGRIRKRTSHVTVVLSPIKGAR